jgi:spore coat polysaccharide biosynthesis predicted glycosyltransferase SpsG
VKYSFIFYCDFDFSSGFGHLMRAAELARVCLQNGCNTLLVTSSPIKVLLDDFILDNYFSSILTKDLLPNIDYSKSVLVIDSYKLQENDYIFTFNWCKIFTIKDKNTPKFNSNLDINQYYEEPKNLANKKEIFWPIVSEKFYEIGKRNIINNGLVTEILVIEGGADNSKFTLAVYNTLRKSSLKFSCTLLSNNLFDLEDSRFSLFPLTYKLPELVEANDVIISTAGNLFWQLLAAKKLIGLGLQASNQESNWNYALRQKIAQPIGEYENGIWNMKVTNLFKLIQDDEVRNDLRSKVYSEKLPGNLSSLYYYLST